MRSAPVAESLATACAVTRPPTPASRGVLGSVLGAELVTAVAVIAASAGQPTPTTADLGIAAYLAGLGIAATTIAVRHATARVPTTGPASADLSTVWAFPAALLLHPVLTVALVVVLHTHRSRSECPAAGRLRRRVLNLAVAVLACLAARAAYTATGAALTAAAVPRVAATWSPTATVASAVLCYCATHRGLRAATAALDPPVRRSGARRPAVRGDRHEAGLGVATACLGGVTAAALAVHPLLVLFMLPVACCLHRAVLAGHLEHAGRYDAKTGLLTAAAWHHQARHAVQRRDPDVGVRAVLVIDVDHFKSVNDTFGHLAGDAVLAAVADAVRDEVRDRDLVGRFGGDEYVVLLLARHGRDHGGTGDGGLLAVAERIRRRVAALQVETSTSDGPILITGVSVSIGGAPAADHDLSALFEQADLALYDAKRAGRGTVRIATDPPPSWARPASTPPDRPAPALVAQRSRSVL